MATMGCLEDPGVMASELDPAATISVADILEEPVRRDLPPEPPPDRLAINPAADGRELQALVADVSVKRDLVAARAARAFAGDEVGKLRLVPALSAVVEFRRVAAE